MARWPRLVDFRPRELAPEISAAYALRPRGDSRGRARPRLRRPRVRRGVRGGGQGAPAGALAEQAAVGGREPAAVRLLAGAADPEGRERLRHLRPAPPGRRAVAARAALGLCVLALVGAGCGDDPAVSPDTSTATTPAASTATVPTTPAATEPQESPGEGDGTGKPNTGGTPAPSSGSGSGGSGSGGSGGGGGSNGSGGTA